MRRPDQGAIPPRLTDDPIFEIKSQANKRRSTQACLLTRRGSQSVRKVATGDGSHCIASHPVGEKGHRQLTVSISPADRGTEPAVPEGTRRARRSRPMPPWISQSTQLEAQPAADWHLKGLINIAVNLDRHHPVDRLGSQDASTVDCATG